MAKRYGDFRVDFFHDGRHSIKSLQRDAVVGHWDGHTLNLGGVGRMAAVHRSVVAAEGRACERRRRRKNEALLKRASFFVLGLCGADNERSCNRLASLVASQPVSPIAVPN